MWIWDYKIAKNWQPKTKKGWAWFLVRKINYGDFKNLTKKTLLKYWQLIKDKLDPGKKMMLENFLK